MNKRVDYCKRLLKKAVIIEANLGPNEKETISKYTDELETIYNNGDLLVDDAIPCKCDIRTDIVAFNDKNYCCNCLRPIKEAKPKPPKSQDQIRPIAGFF